MGKVRTDEEGVNALKTLATTLPQAVEQTQNAADLLMTGFSEKKATLGPHVAQIEQIIEQVKTAQSTGNKSTVIVQVNLIKAAARLAAIIQCGLSTAGETTDSTTLPQGGGEKSPSTSGSSTIQPPNSSVITDESGGSSPLVKNIQAWLGDINPRYHDPFLPPDANPYHVNCGSCAFAVEQRLGGNTAAVASHINIGTDAEMEGWTGKQCTYMPVSQIEQILISQGAGSHLIVGINRRLPSGKSISGHWFNAVYDGQKIYTIDGQSGEILDWPHDYGYISEWCALV